MNNRKRLVLEHAKQLFLEQGVTHTSIQDIVKKANISKGTFYNYFASKNDCLKAILELGEEEISLRRNELLHEQNASDKTIFTKQIAVRLKVNSDQNLLPIIEAIFHSGEDDLSTFAKKFHLQELHWMATRLIDIYGKQAQPFAADCAILLVGMMQHALHFRKSSMTKKVGVTELISYIMRRIDNIMPTLMAKEDTLFGEELFQLLHVEDASETVVKEQLLEHLEVFQHQLIREENEVSLEFITFFIEELQSETPRQHLIQTMSSAFRKSFIGTPHEYTTMKLASEIQIYLQFLQLSTADAK